MFLKKNLTNHSWCQILNRAPGITIHTMKYGMKINVTQKYSPNWQMWKLVVLLILKETFSKHTVLAHVINDWFRPWAKVHKAVTSISIFCESWCFWYNQLISSIFFVKISYVHFCHFSLYDAAFHFPGELCFLVIIRQRRLNSYDFKHLCVNGKIRL